MAQHDYIIANGTGAAVRSDLNGSLAAIVSNNSGATEPATMYAYQWWADTTTGLLKIRNAANSAFITVGTLASANLGLLPVAGGTMTGVLAVTAGTAALPGIAVSGDLNTGLFSPGADTLALVTGGTQRATVDSSGRLLVGTSSARSTGTINWLSQIESTGFVGLGITTNDNGTAGAYLSLAKSRGTSVGSNTIVQNNDGLGYILFSGADGTDANSQAAFICCEVDGTPGADDMPGRLVFSTTADGAASPTERMRITSGGIVEAATQINVKAFGTGVASVGITTGVQVDATADATNCFRVVRVGVGQTFNVTGAGAVSKASGSFKISHPLPNKTNTHYLVHSFIEGPQADLIYRGYVTLINGTAQINVDEVGRMTEGTFEALCTNVCCFTSNETDWTPVRGHVDGNILTIQAQDPTSTAEVCWMVIGERKDPHMLETDWTDENGRVITEPLKEPMPEFEAQSESA